MTAKTATTKVADKPAEDVESKTVAASTRRQTVAASLPADLHDRLETYRWDNRLTKAQVLEQAVAAFLDAQDSPES